MDQREMASMGGKARAAALGPIKLRRAARKAIKARWDRVRAEKGIVPVTKRKRKPKGEAAA